MTHLVQLLLPLYDNQKEAFPAEAFDQVRQELTQKFGGVTAFVRSPAEGFWKSGKGETSRDDVVIVEVMTEQLDRGWWSHYRAELASRFRQEELIVRATLIERL